LNLSWFEICFMPGARSRRSEASTTKSVCTAVWDTTTKECAAQAASFYTAEREARTQTHFLALALPHPGSTGDGVTESCRILA
jgi:hypothetical protein